jgi:hypothetical protein
VTVSGGQRDHELDRVVARDRNLGARVDELVARLDELGLDVVVAGFEQRRAGVDVAARVVDVPGEQRVAHPEGAGEGLSDLAGGREIDPAPLPAPLLGELILQIPLLQGQRVELLLERAPSWNA